MSAYPTATSSSIVIRLELCASVKVSNRTVRAPHRNESSHPVHVRTN